MWYRIIIETCYFLDFWNPCNREHVKNMNTIVAKVDTRKKGKKEWENVDDKKWLRGLMTKTWREWWKSTQKKSLSARKLSSFDNLVRVDNQDCFVCKHSLEKYFLIIILAQWSAMHNALRIPVEYKWEKRSKSKKSF